MCTICLMLDRDMPFPTPKELARNINEVLPTEEHLNTIKKTISKKLTRNDFDYESGASKKYLDLLDKELASDLFKHEYHDLRES